MNFIKRTLQKFNDALDIKTDSNTLTVIDPITRWQKRDFSELVEYRDLFFLFAWRQIKVMYAQTILGFSWAILKPFVQIVIFTIIFGTVAKVPTEGVPYFLFSCAAIVPWSFISQAISESSQSLITNSGMLGKVYFPRVIFPLTPVFSRLIDFGISMLIVLCAMLYYHVYPTRNLLLFPLFVFTMMLVPTGIGLWLSSLAIRYRDVNHAMVFIIQMLVYTAPIVYSASSIPAKYRYLYSLNPIVGVIEGFRACLLGTPVPWSYIIPGVITSVILIITGAIYFKRMEKIIVDVI
ncbi:MAG: ABC transporter permease [Nitrospirae bacterium]|nr:ABC transporter permease [Nitrospirota bacterium]